MFAFEDEDWGGKSPDVLVSGPPVAWVEVLAQQPWTALFVLAVASLSAFALV